MAFHPNKETKPKYDWRCKSCGHLNAQYEKPTAKIEICENCKDATENVDVQIPLGTVALGVLVLVLIVILALKTWA